MSRKRTSRSSASRNSIKLILILIVVALYYFYSNGSINTSDNTQAPQDSESTYVSGGTRIHFVDVGQGDCTIIESNGEYMIIDAGEAKYRDDVTDYIRSLNIDTFKYAIASHPHSDHIGSLGYVISEFNVENIIMPDVTSTSRPYERLLNAINDKNVTAYEAIVGDNYNFGDCSFTIIGPSTYDEDNLNNDSVAIKLVHGNDKMILAGDAEEDEEEQILATGFDLDVDLFKAGHHGSRTSSTEPFLSAMTLKYVVISCGKGNEYGHPHKEALDRFKSMGIKYLRTDESGNIVFESTGNGLNILQGTISGSELSASN